MAVYKHESLSNISTAGRTEFDILKASHRFLRPEDEKYSSLSWSDRVAKKYYSSLYREYAVCDLKHYKSGNFSLRWRTEDEVVSGAGETTCGNTRCSFHDARRVEERRPSLSTLELPFSYVEDGESKFALVKVVLCSKCTKKLMYKRNKEKQAEHAAMEIKADPVKEETTEITLVAGDEREDWQRDSRNGSGRHRSANRERRTRSSRSHSPTRTRDTDRWRRSP